MTKTLTKTTAAVTSDVILDVKGSTENDISLSSERYLSRGAAAAIIASWNTTSTLINFPSIIGILGTVGGVLAILLLQGLALFVTLHMIDLCKYFEDNGVPCSRFSQFGQRLFGNAGRRLFVFTQMANQVGVLVYAMVLMVSSLQTIFSESEWLQCNFRTCLIVIGFGYLLVQVSRDWKDFHWLAYLTLALAITVSILLIIRSFTLENTFGGNTPLFVGMDYTCDPASIVGCKAPIDQYSFINVMSALGSVVFAFAPCFITCELYSEMKYPEVDTKTSMKWAFTFSTGLYILVGLVYAINVGNQVPQAVQAYVYDSGAWESIVVAVFLLLAMVTDFVICLLTINRECIAVLRPGFDYKWTWSNAVTWSWVTFIPITATFMLAILVPNLESIIGFVDTFSIPYSQLVFPCIFCLPWLTSMRRGTDNENQLLEFEMMPLSRNKLIVLFCTSVYGITFSLLKSGIFVYGLTKLSFSGSYWCDEVAAL